LDDQSYTYHGDDAGLAAWVAMFTSRSGDGGGDHEQAFLSALEFAAACKADGAFLDVGSGVGRIVGKVRSYARHVTGLEPDERRHAACQAGYANDPGVEILNTTTDRYRKACPRRRFDLITVSMVIQHVSAATCEQILRDVRHLLAPNGVAVISTTHFFEERFTYEADLSPHDFGEFNRYAEDTSVHDRGLPVRMFSKDALHREVEKAGLEAVVWEQFSYVRPENVGRIAALYNVAEDQVRDCALSQYVVARGPSRRSGALRRLADRFLIRGRAAGA
jgi:SAM-dependent methyltransferase